MKEPCRIGSLPLINWLHRDYVSYVLHGLFFMFVKLYRIEKTRDGFRKQGLENRRTDSTFKLRRKECKQ